MLRVKITSQRLFQWVPPIYIFMQKYDKYSSGYLRYYIELWLDTMDEMYINVTSGKTLLFFQLKSYDTLYFS